MSLKNLSSEQRRAMLSQLLKKKASEKKKTFPLSFAQQRLWFLDQLEPGNAFYNVPAVLSMVGTVDKDALEKSLNEIVQRHEVLRSVITMVDEQPIQRIEEDVHIPLPLIDLCEQPYEQRKAAALRQAHADVLQPFDLSSGRLIRAKLLKLDEQEYILLLMMHHIVSDGWSMDVFLRELTVLYQAFAQGEPSPLPELPIQYIDFAVWQRDEIRKEDQKKDLEYWRQQLADLQDLELPTDHPRPAIQSYRGATQRFTISKELTEKLKALSQQEGVSMFMTLLAVFNTLLYRYTGQTDIGIGSAIANRNRKELEDLIGFFVNTLVLRTNLKDNPSFRQLLQDVRETVLSAYAHQDLPFEKLVEEIQPERSLSRQPLFQVMFIFHNFPPPTLKLPALTLEPINIETGSAKFDLQLAIIDIEDGLSGWLEYSTDLFEPSMIQQMQDHLLTLLTAVVRDPDQSINHLAIVSPIEIEQISLAGLVPVRTGDQQDDFFQQFMRHYAEQPASLALSSSEAQLSVAQLLQLTNQVTHHLHEQGLAAGTTIALALPRSIERVVTQLALLQLGVTYLPLALSAPPLYRASQLNAGNVQYILTRADFSERFSSDGIPVLPIHLNDPRITSQSIAPWQTEMHAGDCVALLPSAGHLVAFTRTALNHQIHWLQQQFRLTPIDTILHTALPEAEHDVWTLAWSLANGVPVVLPTDEELQAPDQLQYLIHKHKASIFVTTPTLLATLICKCKLDPQTTRLLLCSGGMIPTSIAQTCLANLPGKLYSLYNHPASGTFFLAHMDAAYLSGSPESIQGSVTHSSLVLLDKYQQVVPEGIYADFYVKYVDRGEERLLKTGYRGRYRRQSGYMLAAKPERVLQREGQAIALDEVQDALLAYPACDDAVVLMRMRDRNIYEMIAYVVPTGIFVEKRMKDDLAQRISATMLPDYFVPLISLPLTKAGSIDNARLLNLDSTDPLVLADWQERVNALVSVERAVIVPQEYVEPVPVQHLSDLIYAWKATMNNDQSVSQEVSSSTDWQAGEDGDDDTVMAWSDGGPLIIPEDAPKTFTEALFRTATLFKDKGITYIQADGSALFQSYGMLLEEAKRILGGLHQLGFKQGDTAILQIDNWRYHFSTFWACVLAGITPVTVAVAQTYTEKNSVVNKLYNIWKLLDHPPILSNEHLVIPLKGLNQFWPMSDLKVLSVESLLKSEPSEDIYHCRPEDRVFFQLTSGSTGVPKCIQETHRGVIAHIHGGQQFNGYSSDDINLNWLPMDHVVPILTCHLKDVYLGCSQIEVKTDIILSNPLRWLDLIEEYKATLTWAPNFGFKLVSDWLTKNVQDRTWDLSSLRYCMNAGEQVTLPVVSEFLRLTASFGIRPQCMQPSFGMAEACTCMTFQNNFTVEAGTHRFEKSSLSRRLKVAARDDAKAVSFIDLGPPVPGIQIRITNEHNQLLPERVIGRFQIKGDVITPGYYKNPEANADAFVGDGWFNSGDLGFILDGSLTLTGREKEVIIINGANYYCYEIEDIVNTIAGVEPTFAGACSVEDTTTGTGGLAIFFTPSAQDLSDIVPLLSTIRSEVVTNIGINPAYIVPLARSAFAKTTSGKIQRTQMKKSLLAGDYEHILKQLDLYLRNQNTLPDWFFYKRWQQRQAEYQLPVQTDGVTLVFMDMSGLGAQLADALQQQGQEVICVEAGTSYRQIATHHYRVEVQTTQHYHDMLRELQGAGKVVRSIVHLWNYDFVPSAIENVEQLEAAHTSGLYSLLLLIQALTAIYGKQQTRLYVVASQSQYVASDDELSYIRATVSGFLKTAAQEMPWLHCHHIDLPAFQHDQNLYHLRQELSLAQAENEVVYRDGRRLVPRLAMMNWEKEQAHPLPFVQGGSYVLSGGLGGVGIEIARYLLQNYQARILLLGRSVLPDRSLWSTHRALGDEYSGRLEALRILEQLDGDISYAAINICDEAQLISVVEQAEQRWQRSVDGIFHLAGAYNERLLEAEHVDTLAEEIRAKVSGAWTLHQLALQRPQSLFVSFSSVNGFFGGVSVGAYAAANSFLDSFVHYQRSLGLNSYCFAWSTWDETGMSSASQIKELSQARGYYALKPRQALAALEVGLTHTQPYMLIGLDATNQNIRRYSQREGITALQQATAFVQMRTGQQFQKQFIPANYNVVQLMELPVTSAGEVDLARLVQIDHRVITERVAARNDDELQLTRIWQNVLGVAEVSIHDNFFSLGGDSILSLQIVSRANQSGLAITPRMLFQYQTIAHLAEAISQSIAGPQISAQQEHVTGLIPLTPIQRWFFEQQFIEPQHWNQSFLLKAHRPLDPALLEQALAQILIQHDALRIQFLIGDDGWQQIGQEPSELSQFHIVDLSEASATEQKTVIEQEAERAQASLDLSDGLVRATYFDLGQQQPARFLLVIHHLIVDGISWRIILEDLQTAYEQLESQMPVALPAKSTSFQYWSRKLYEYAQSEACRAELPYWLQQIDQLQRPSPIPVDYEHGVNTVGSTRTITFSLTETETKALLFDVPAIYRTQMDDVLLTALAQAFMGWTGDSHLLLNLEGHGREDIIETADISRTIGWFTSLYPVQLDLDTLTRPGPMLKHIKEQLRRIPQRGLHYGLLRYLTEDRQIAEQLRQLPQAEISFNYLGQFDQAFSQTALFSPASESGGSLTSPNGQRPHLLDIFGIIGAGQLHMSWTYSEHVHQAETIERLASSFMHALQNLIAHCQQAKPGSYTLSDFPLAKLTEEQLDSLTTSHADIESIYPLSPLQQGLLFHTLSAPNTGDYITQIYCTLQGSFDKEAFLQAWQIVVSHHPALRAALSWEELVDAHQIVYRTIPIHLNEHDWRQMSGEEQEELFEHYLYDDRIQGFDLTQVPLMRFHLFRLQDEVYRFAWSHHHIMLDGWSVPIIFRDVFASYEALYHHQPVEIPPARSYQNYIQWLQQQDLRKSEIFWRRTFKGFTHPVTLGLERPVVQKLQQDEVFLHLSEELTQSLQKLARQLHVTLNTLVQGLWSILLSRYSGQDDIVFGITVAGRPAAIAGVEAIVGMFINTIPVRIHLQTGVSIRDWLKSLQDQQSELLQYEHSSLAQIQNWSDIPRGTALFNSIFVFENYPFSREELASSTGLSVQAVHSHEQTHYPLTVVVIPEQALTLKLIYSQDTYTEAQMEQMLAHMQVALDNVVSDPEQRLDQLSLLTRSEQAQIHDWNETTVDYPKQLSLYRFFEEQAQKTPAARSVIFGREEISYVELDQRANMLAAYLQERGIGPNVLVGLCMERSLEMMIGLLGVLKAGGAYVPLDPVYPQERLAFILQDAQVTLLLTQERCLPSFVDSRVAVVCLDTVWPTLTQRYQGIPLREIPHQEDNLAYVIYTSGSTGQPKGVCITHRSATAFVQWALQRFSREQLAGVLASTSICFDLSVFEIFVPLSCGGTVILAQNALHLPELPAANQVTLINTVPSAVTALYRSEGIPASVRCINLAGEPLPQSLVQQLYTLEHVEQIYNLYGPTEDTTYSTWALIARGHVGNVPIGRPIANTQTYLLDQHLRPVPLGVPGELYLGGAGLAQGYFQRPELTAERFIPHPFGTFGTRLYRTGDLARYTASGMLEYLGRMDQQIKLRGFRIELGEIEHVLMQHADVREAVVIIHQSASDTQQLVAYVVLDDEVSTQELREHVQKSLPDYMVPAMMVPLEALPLTPNGKVDRLALFVPETHRSTDLAAPQPGSPVEKQLLEIWQQVLGEQNIHVHDNFFALGGDSIVSIHIVTQAKRAGIQITPTQLFKFPTIAALADVVTSQHLSAAIETEQGLISGPVSLTPIQHWFFNLELQQQQHWNQAILLSVQRLLDTILLKRAITYVFEHHDALRMSFSPIEQGWSQTSSDRVSTSIFTIVDHSRMDVAEQQNKLDAVVAEVQGGFDLLTGPLMRIVYIDRGDSQTARLLLVAHHLVVDAFSWSILLEDLQQVYQQLEAEQAISLPTKTTSFQSWAARLVEHSQGEQLRQELSYWQEMIASDASLEQPARLPLDLSDGADTVEHARTYTVTLSTEETQALLSAVPSTYHTQIDDVLLTALAQALTGWIESSSILINREGHGREELFAEVDLSRTVGWFTSLMPVRLTVPEAGDVIATLKAVKEQLHQMPHHGIGYGLLRYLCQDQAVKAQLQALPTPELVFNYLGQLDQTLAGGTLFGPAPETLGAMVSPYGQRPHLLEINGYIADKRLHISWTYSQNRHFARTIETLGASMIQALQSIIQHCQLPESGGYTPSDFSLVRLTQEQIDLSLSGYAAIDAAYPLSPLQQGLLFHTMFAPEDGNYVTQIVCTLQGTMQMDAFVQAWQQVFQRHPVLRTAFVWLGLDEPIQLVSGQVQVPCIQLDWYDIPEIEQQERFATLLKEDRLQNFDLTQAPLMRLYVIKTGEERYQFLWSHHHLLLDGWSIPIVLRDAFMTYEMLSHRKAFQIESRVYPYQDYIIWLQEQKLVAAENYWRQALQGISDPTPLSIGGPAKHSIDAHHSYKEHTISLSHSLTLRMQNMVRQEHITLNTLLQGVWALALSRYSGQDAVIFGNVVSGRAADVRGIEEMVGLFINTLPVCVRFSPGQDVRSWLLDLQQQQTEMRQYEYSPLAQIQNWSEFSGAAPLFESLFAFENYPLSDAERGTEASLVVKNVYSVEQTNYPLNIVVMPGAQLAIKVIYEQERFDKATIDQLLDHLENLCDTIITHPTQKLASISMLTNNEQGQILDAWTATQSFYPVDKCVHQLFEAQAHKHANSLAIATATQEISYAELNRRANQLAHYLTASGVGPDVLVGICMERSLEMIVALLAVLKAGGAYVPMDPAYPTERLAFMLEDAQVEILLTQQQFAAILPEESRVQYFFLDREWERIVTYPAEDLGQAVASQHLAYMIYTSGSSGLPKGVQITHAGLLNLVFWHQGTYAVTLQDRATQVAGVAFDASVWEIWPYLAAGASLHIPDETIRLSPQLLRDWMLQVEITISFLPTPLAERMLALQWPAEGALRAMLTGGDKLHVSPEKALPFRLVNHYGPTESTVVATAGEVQPGLQERAPSIGKAINNTRVYILDRHFQPVPVGTPGELYIGGASLARGYWHQPDLTAERFIADPFSREEGARLYRTGDLVSYLQDGSIEFLSRLDDQVKVRGYRIELGEIESILSQHETIDACVVIAHEDAGVKHLVAYVVTVPQQQLLTDDLRRYLEARLPSYMVPPTFIALEALPLTANGKVDRRALQTSDDTYVQMKRTLIAPRTDVEAKLVALWQQVIGVAAVSIHDNFFALGGDSIVSIQIVARASQAGLHITPKMLFQYPTIAELATVVVSNTTETMIEAEQGMVTGDVSLMPIQHWFFEQQLSEPWHWNQALLVNVPLGADRQTLKDIATHLLKHHDALRLRYTQTEHAWQQNSAPADETNLFSVIDLSASAPDEYPAAIERVANEVQSSLDLQSGPIVRFVYFDLGHEVLARLLIVVHHLAIDGVSWRILLEDIRNLYTQISQQLPVQLPKKTTSFQHWADKLAVYSQSSALREELPYWMRLAQQQIVPLPVDYVSMENTVLSTRHVTVSLSEDETRALLQDVPQAYRTQMNDVLLTALAQTMAGWTKQASLLLDLEGHGREEIVEHTDLSRTVGWFTSMYPILLELDASEQPAAALKRIKEQLHQIPQHGIGYGLLRYLCEDEDVRAHMRDVPEANLSFNYLGQFDQSLSEETQFTVASESSGQPISSAGKRQHLIDIVSSISGGQLHIDWSYSVNLHTEETVIALAQNYVQALQALIVHCQSSEVGGYTPSDFPLAMLSQEQIDTMLGNDREVEAVYPLSPLQQGLLFHSLYVPDGGDYVVQTRYTFKGTVHVANFMRAWQQAIHNHAVLRTYFLWEGLDQPLQVVRQHAEMTLIQHDWRHLSAEEQQVSLRAYVQADRLQGFDLAKSPLMHVTLLQMDDDIYECIWSHHHLLLDGWSLPLVLKDVFDSYEAFHQGREQQLQSARAYQDYIAWLSGQQLDKAEIFWKQLLADFSEPTRLGSRYDSGLALEEQKQTYDERTLTLSNDVTQALQQLARGQRLTLNTLVQGAWALLLSHFSGQQDVVFGSVVSGRPSEIAAVETMVGLFINTLPVRVRIRPEQTLQDWLQEIQAQLTETRQYEFTPLVQIQGWSEIARGDDLFESLFIFENYPLETSEQEYSADLQILDVHAYEQTNYPLTVFVLPGNDLKIKLIFEQHHFSVEYIQRLLQHLQQLLEHVVAEPEQHLGHLPLLSESEQQRVVQEWNATQAAYPVTCTHQLIESQVERTPDAQAIIFEGKALTYRELNAQANQFAQRLQSLGVGPDVLVGLYLERSLEMMVAVLGVLKAGGAYVPLDLAYPQDRVAYVLRDSGMKVIVTQEHLLSLLPETHINVCCLDTEWKDISQNTVTFAGSPVHPENAAYIIYTSGSTGQPKGVSVSHRSVANLATMMIQRPGISDQDVFLALTTLSFDISVLELLVPLMVGAKVVLAGQGGAADGDYIADILESSEITIMQATPSTWRILMNSGWEGKKDVKLFSGGEDLPQDLANHLLKRSAELWNMYGPTETTIWSSINKVEKGMTNGSVSIGYPIGNTQMYVLDSALRPVPIGVPGDLYIAGDGVSDGYIHRAALTAERFIANPFGEQGTRMYRTGDLACYQLDGSLLFLGRSDYQIKIRGRRIELGEIESALNQYATIRENAVIAREDVPGNQRLVAYVVCDGIAPTLDELRRHLAISLPEYMIPASFIFMDTLPLTANGKLNRRALPVPDASRPELNEAFVAPRNAVEAVLVRQWSELLQVEHIGIHDNFFVLGGHSLLATQLTSRLSKVFQMKLPLRSVFEAATIAGMAEVIVKYEKAPGQVVRIAEFHQKIAAMSPEEVRAALQAQEKRRK